MRTRQDYLGKSVRTAVVAGCLALLGMLLSTAPARAAFGDGFGIMPGSFSADAYQVDGVTPERRAGSHPDSVRFAFEVNSTIVRGFEGLFPLASQPDGILRDVEVSLPRGFVGLPTAAATCTVAQLRATAGFGDLANGCPQSSQIGVIALDLSQGAARQAPQRFPVFNMKPPPGVLADFGFGVFDRPVHIRASLNPVDYSIRAVASQLNDSAPVFAQKLTLWGTPADPSHDTERCVTSAANGDPVSGYVSDTRSCTAGIVPKPFFTMPSQCGVDAVSTLRVDSWQHPGAFTPLLSAPTPAAQVAGCELLNFGPTMSAQPTVKRPDSPTGFNVTLSFPRSDNPSALDTPPLRKAVVTLPEGFTINASSVDGLQSCSDDQLGLGTDRPIGCPDGAKIGSIQAQSPAIDAPIAGSIYLRSQASDDPQSGLMYRLALVLENKDRGLLIKLPGSVRADATSGRLQTTFDNNPQLPVSTIELRFKDGPRAPLATPPTCGPQSVAAELTSWAGQVANLSDTFTIDCPGVQGFAPSMVAGTTNPVAGAYSPFALQINRNDGQQYLDGLSLTLPPGLLATLKAVPRCGEVQAGAGNCPASARVGTATVGAGAGTNPYFLSGAVYLTGPYKGAPFGLVAQVRVLAGPFDLGEVVVRQKIYVDPIDAHVTVVSDPLPTIVKGVPVRLQRLDVSIDKPAFTLNPTSCAPNAIGGTLGAVDGQSAAISVPFQVGNCDSLALKPTLALSLSGKGQTTDGKHPAVTANLTQPQGDQANLKKVRVALPLSLALDPDNANGLCEFVDGSKTEPTCPKNSIVGTATATTPILDEPLTGPVYFVKNIRKDPKSGREIRTLPKLVIPLVGENGVKLTLTGTSNVIDNQLVTTFDNIPDAPVSSFKLNINGGKGGILTVSGTDICKATQIADQQIDGQNNKQADTDIYIQTPACPTKIISKTIDKTTVKLKIGGLGAGKVTVTGRGIKKTTKTIAKSTVATITAKRTKGKPGKVTVSFDPTGPAKAHKTTN